MLGLKERFNILLENYAEFERELLDITRDRALSFRGEWNENANTLHTVNRRLVNLLSTCELYPDQLHHILSDLAKKDKDVRALVKNVAASVKQQTSKEYDSRFGYRVIEAVRNHVQHRSLPVHRIMFAST